MNCKNCNSEIPSDAKRCQSCGASVTHPATGDSSSSEASTLQQTKKGGLGAFIKRQPIFCVCLGLFLLCVVYIVLISVDFPSPDYTPAVLPVSEDTTNEPYGVTLNIDLENKYGATISFDKYIENINDTFSRIYTEYESPPLVNTRAEDQAFIEAAATIVSQNLKSPSTATTSSSSVVAKDNFGRAIVLMSVDAQNAYGTFVRENFCVAITGMSYNGETFYHEGASNNITTYKNGERDTAISLMKSINSFGIDPKEKEHAQKKSTLVDQGLWVDIEKFEDLKPFTGANGAEYFHKRYTGVNYVSYICMTVENQTIVGVRIETTFPKPDSIDNDLDKIARTWIDVSNESKKIRETMDTICDMTSATPTEQNFYDGGWLYTCENIDNKLVFTALPVTQEVYDKGETYDFFQNLHEQTVDTVSSDNTSEFLTKEETDKLRFDFTKLDFTDRIKDENIEKWEFMETLDGVYSVCFAKGSRIGNTYNYSAYSLIDEAGAKVQSIGAKIDSILIDELINEPHDTVLNKFSNVILATNSNLTQDDANIIFEKLSISKNILSPFVSLSEDKRFGTAFYTEHKGNTYQIYLEKHSSGEEGFLYNFACFPGIRREDVNYENMVECE